MKIIFCAQPFTPTIPDPDYAVEVEAATQAGFECDLIDFEELVYESNPEKAVKRVRSVEPPVLAVFRGWMLRPFQYAQLYEALKDKGLKLINDPASYKYCHYFPESYFAIEPHTPQSRWLPFNGELNMDAIMELLRPFGERPLIVKDFVKSRKHEWAEACFVPAANDREAVERVVTRFVELQGEDLNEGLVFREYEPFQALTQHAKSGMPLSQEYRLFFANGKRLSTYEYWEEVPYEGTPPPTGQFEAIAPRIKSHFFTMDVARRADGGWRVIELGDGQVAGLPGGADVQSFYNDLFRTLTTVG